MILFGITLQNSIVPLAILILWHLTLWYYLALALS